MAEATRLRRERPPPSPSMSLRPVAAAIVQPPAQKQLAQSMTASLEIFPASSRARHGSRTAPFPASAGAPPSGARAQELGELAGIAPICFDPLAGFPRDERRRDHPAAHTRRRQ